MTFDQCVTAVAKFGVTERQARFLVTVMQHGGVCVPRQYARFAKKPYGHTVSRFFDKLVRRRWAVTCDCVHNRAQLYHVRHQALYRAIDDPDSRYRRPVSKRLAIERLMILDAMLDSTDLSWLGTETEKVAFFNQRAPSLPRDWLPHKMVGPLPGRVRLFPDDLPIGVDGTGRVVFLYLVTTCVDLELQAFVQRLSELLRALPAWTIRLVSPPDGAGLEASENTVRYELTNQFSPEIIRDLKWYFEQCRSTTDARALSYTDENFWLAKAAFSTRQCRVLYRRWLSDGDHVFELVSSPLLAHASSQGAGRIESRVLPFSYRHLSPSIEPGRSVSQGVEEGDTTPAQPRPPLPEPSRRLTSPLLAPPAL